MSNQRSPAKILSDHQIVNALLGFNMLSDVPVESTLRYNPYSFRAAEYHIADFDAVNETLRGIHSEELWNLCNHDSTQYLELLKLTILQVTLNYSLTKTSPVPKIPRPKETGL